MKCSEKFFFLKKQFLDIASALTFLHNYKVVFKDIETTLIGFELNLDTIVVSSRITEIALCIP